MRLPDVLDIDDLPLAELCALRLDGELYGLGDGFRPVDSPDDLLARALSLGGLLRDGRIAHRETAAWILGALLHPPRPMPFCVHAGRSKGIDPSHGTVLSEAILLPEEVIDIRGVLLTSPIRTVVDLIRLPDQVPAAVREDAALEVMLLHRVTAESIAHLLSDRRFQRERVRATRVLEQLRVGLDRAQPADTR